MTNELWTLAAIGYHIYLIVTIIFLLLDNRETSATFAWIFVLIAFPVAGLILYILIGRNPRNSQKYVRLQQHVMGHMGECLKHIQPFEHDDPASIFKSEGFEPRKKLFELLYRSSNSRLTTRNTISLFYCGDEKFTALISDIQNAEKFIHMEYFIWREDVLTNRIADLLIRKRAQGLDVRILYDVIGSFGISSSYIRKLRRAGIRIFPYDNLRSRISLHSLNYRNHRKIAVIDGQIAYTGGMNMGQEYIDGGRQFKQWRDTHMRITGESVAILSSIFAGSWYHTTGEDISGARYFPSLQSSPDPCAVQITTSGPDSPWSSIEQLYFALINTARKSVYIQSPYFIPSQSIYKALLNAALGGVAVHIMMTGIPDRHLPFWAAYSFFEPLLRSGVKIYQYQHGFLHAKMLSIDDAICSVGTANMDIRSFQLNYEVNMLIYDDHIARNLAGQFVQDQKFCKVMTLADYERLGILKNFRNSIARLFAPIM